MKGYDIIVLGGQSNAEGYGVGEVTEEYVPTDKVLYVCDEATPHYEGSVLHLNYPSGIKVEIADEPVGEHDSVENPDFSTEKRYETHKRNLSAMFGDFISRYADKAGGKIPFIAGGFCDEWYERNKVACDAVLRAIRETISELGGAFVDTHGLLSNNQKTANGDGIHFSRESAHILGSRYFDAFKSVKE